MCSATTQYDGDLYRCAEPALDCYSHLADLGDAVLVWAETSRETLVGVSS